MIVYHDPNCSFLGIKVLQSLKQSHKFPASMPFLKLGDRDSGKASCGF
jgi:hypothetical protein